MIALNRRTKFFVCKEPTNLHLSYDGLFHKVKKIIKKDPFSGHVFLFVNRSRTSCKALYYDTTGLVILAKRMEGNRLFSRINPLYSKELVLTESEFGLYFEGADLEKRFVDTSSEIKKKRIKKLPFLRSRSTVSGNGTSIQSDSSGNSQSPSLR
jgi:transposase